MLWKLFLPFKCYVKYFFSSSETFDWNFPYPLIAQLLSSVLKLYSFVYFGQSLILESMLSWSRSYVSFDPNYIPITSQRARKSMD